jgi:hypothetical protein
MHMVMSANAHEMIAGKKLGREVVKKDNTTSMRPCLKMILQKVLSEENRRSKTVDIRHKLGYNKRYIGLTKYAHKNNVPTYLRPPPFCFSPFSFSHGR